MLLDIKDKPVPDLKLEDYPTFQGVVKDIVFIRKGINKVPVVRLVEPVKVAERVFTKTINMEYPYNIIMQDAYPGNIVRFKYIEGKIYPVCED